MQIHIRAFFFLFVIQGILLAQKVITIENKLDDDHNDSSYYDLVQIEKGKFWLIGKNGFFKVLGEDGHVLENKCGFTNRDLLSISFFNHTEGLITGDRGTVIFFNITKNSFELMTLTKYKNRCFYTSCVINDSTAIMGGGNQLTAKGKKSIPMGIILKTTNKGKTWTRVHSTLFRMIWDVLYVRSTGQVMASSYSLNGTVVIQSKDIGQTWQKAATTRALIHDLSEQENEVWASGSSGFQHIENQGKIFSVTNNKPVFSEDTLGLIWNVTRNHKYTIACLSKGRLMYRKNDDTRWTLLDLQVNKSLYKAVFIDENSAFILGSRQVLVKVDFEESGASTTQDLCLD